MEGRGESQNLDNFATVSRGILQTVPRNLAKIFLRKTVDPTYIICIVGADFSVCLLFVFLYFSLSFFPYCTSSCLLY